MEEKGHVSRALLCKELSLGEGVIRTLLKHLKMQGLIKSTKNGTRLTEKGMTTLSGLLSSVPAEMSIPKSSVALGKFNYVVLLKQFGFAVKSGIEQRCCKKRGQQGPRPCCFKHSKYRSAREAGADLQSNVGKLEELNESLRNRDKMKDDAIAQLSDQLTYGFDNNNAGT